MIEWKSRASGTLGLLIGGLALVAPATGEAKPYKGGELYSSQSYLYGRIEVRMRMARGSGILSTFFTYKNGSEIEGTFWEELDIEVFGKDGAASWQSNIITGLGTRATSEQVHQHTASLADDYHTYTLEWTPDRVVWLLDGVEVRRSTGGQVADLVSPQSLRFNIWAAAATEWVGVFDTGALPQYQYVNWIRYSRYEGGQFVHEWTDDFDSFDGSRWARADWTFAENLVDFDPNNVVVRDGTLILALTTEGQTGFSGTVPDDSGGDPGGTGGASGTGGYGTGGYGTGGYGTGGYGTGGYGTGGYGTGGYGTGGTMGDGGSVPGGTGGAATGGAGVGGVLPSGGGSPSTGGVGLGTGGDVFGTGGSWSAGGVTGSGGSAPPPPSGGTGATAAVAVPGESDAGCSCRLGADHGMSRTGWSLLGLGLLGSVRRRRAPRSAVPPPES